MDDLLTRFKDFVRSQGYELVISDHGISIEELIGSFKTKPDSCKGDGNDQTK